MVLGPFRYIFYYDQWKCFISLQPNIGAEVKVCRLILRVLHRGGRESLIIVSCMLYFSPVSYVSVLNTAYLSVFFGDDNLLHSRLTRAPVGRRFFFFSLRFFFLRPMCCCCCLFAQRYYFYACSSYGSFFAREVSSFFLAGILRSFARV